jgi:hypothetical protein
MAFTIPEGLHPDLNPLAWMIGTWRGKGRGEYPTIDTFEYAHEVVFNHDGRPFMNYYSRSWIIDADGEILRPGGSEAGFWRVKPNNVLEVVISHSTGISEGWVGQFDGPKIQLVIKGIQRQLQRLLLPVSVSMDLLQESSSLHMTWQLKDKNFRRISGQHSNVRASR